MRKFFYLAMIAMVAFVATSCKDGKPSSLKGTWEDRAYAEIDGVRVESLWTLTVTSSDETNAPATLYHVFGEREEVNTQILVNYSDGKGTFASADGSKTFEGTIKAESKDEIVLNITKNGNPYLANGLFVKK